MFYIEVQVQVGMYQVQVTSNGFICSKGFQGILEIQKSGPAGTEHLPHRQG